MTAPAVVPVSVPVYEGFVAPKQSKVVLKSVCCPDVGALVPTSTVMILSS